jgi:hypothetical protein
MGISSVSHFADDAFVIEEVDESDAIESSVAEMPITSTIIDEGN